ncbi:MAG: exonuclease subunit SbcD [Clostridia bacterium]|nr:exonuclease subunit SbcD [Clostridia bacterium]
MKIKNGLIMKFLHTSDLHIGKKLDGKSRIDEQAQVLSEIVGICEAEKVDVVLLAGDVFDTFIPSAEAEELFFEFASSLSASKRAVIAVSGNHDDADRLLASRVIAMKQGIFLCGGDNDFPNCSIGDIKITACGKNYIVVERKEEKVFIATVGYFSEAPVGEVVDKEKSYDERVKDIFEKTLSNNGENYPAILLTHLFMVGGTTTEGERPIDLGGARVIKPSTVPTQFVYTALGHLHRRQVALKDRNIIYSGSPLQYSYDEAGTQKSVTVFEISGGEVKNLKEIPLTKGKKLAAISVVGVENAEEKLAGYEDYHICLTVFSDKPIAATETKAIMENHPEITQFRLSLTSSSGSAIKGRREMNDEELFKAFIKARYGEEPDDELMTAYREIMSEE